MRANSRLNHPFVWTRRTKLVCIKLGRFDMHPTPTLLIEGQANRVDDRILSAYVNIEATLYVFQGAPKYNIFKILRVRSYLHSLLQRERDKYSVVVELPCIMSKGHFNRESITSERRAAAQEAMDLVALVKEELGKTGAILTSHASNYGSFCVHTLFYFSFIVTIILPSSYLIYSSEILISEFEVVGADLRQL